MSTNATALILPLIIAAPLSFWTSRYFKEFSFITRAAAGFAAAWLGYEVGDQIVSLLGLQG